MTSRLRALSLLLLAALALGVPLYLLGRVAGFTSPWLVLLAMLNFLGLVRVARPLVRLRLPRPLREVCPWELQGDAYRALGVPAYGALLRRTPLRHLNPHVYASGAASGYTAVCEEAESAEAAHLLAIVLTIPYLAYVTAHRRWAVLLLFAVAHLAANVYPVLHLRLVRGRIERVLDRRLARLDRGSSAPGRRPDVEEPRRAVDVPRPTAAGPQRDLDGANPAVAESHLDVGGQAAPQLHERGCP